MIKNPAVLKPNEYSGEKLSKLMKKIFKNKTSKILYLAMKQLYGNEEKVGNLCLFMASDLNENPSLKSSLPKLIEFGDKYFSAFDYPFNSLREKTIFYTELKDYLLGNKTLEYVVKEKG